MLWCYLIWWWICFQKANGEWRNRLVVWGYPKGWIISRCKSNSTLLAKVGLSSYCRLRWTWNALAILPESHRLWYTGPPGGFRFLRGNRVHLGGSTVEDHYLHINGYFEKGDSPPPPKKKKKKKTGLQEALVYIYLVIFLISSGFLMAHKTARIYDTDSIIRNYKNNVLIIHPSPSVKPFF